MSKVKLREVVSFAQKRISISELNIEDYISTDNLLQNKLGVEKISNLPKSINNTPKYEPGNILVSNIRPYLKKIYYAKGQGGASSDVLIFVVKEKFDSKFVYYNLFQDSFFEHMMVGAKGTKMPRGDKNQILEYEIPYFDLPTQQKIASVLSALDDKIELNNKINAELEAMAKTLYDYWFVQFDFPNQESKPYKSSGGKMVYNPILKREIPEGWEVKRFGDVFNVSRGTIITKETSKEGQYKVVAAGLNYSYLHNEFNREKYTITVSGSGANAGYINFWTERIFASDCTTVRGCNDYMTFIGLQFLKLYQDYIFSLAKGSAQPHVYPSDIEGLNFTCIPDKLITEYGVYAMNIFEKISNNQKQNQELAQLRDWLLPMLMNGQVKVE